MSGLGKPHGRRSGQISVLDLPPKQEELAKVVKKLVDENVKPAVVAIKKSRDLALREVEEARKKRRRFALGAGDSDAGDAHRLQRSAAVPPGVDNEVFERGHG